MGRVVVGFRGGLGGLSGVLERRRFEWMWFEDSGMDIKRVVLRGLVC